MLESRIEIQRHYDSLFNALNNKMTSFFEELNNFASSSRGNAPCEQKRQKLQELCSVYEVLQKDLSEVSQAAQGVKQSTSPTGVARIQEALDMQQSKMRGNLARLDYLKEAVEQPPLQSKSQKKKPKKEKKKKTGQDVQSTFKSLFEPVSPTAEPSVETSGKVEVESSVPPDVELASPAPKPAEELCLKPVPPTAETSVETPVKVSVESSVQPGVELASPAPKPSVHLELSVQPSVQSADKLWLKPSASCKEILALDLAVKPAPEQSVQLTRELSLHTVADSSVQYAEFAEELPQERVVQTVAEEITHPAAKLSVVPMVQSSLQPAVEPPEVLTANTAEEPSAQPQTDSSAQLSADPSIQTSVQKLEEPSVESGAGPIASETTVQPLEEASFPLDARGFIQLAEEPSVQSAATSGVPVEPSAKTLIPPAIDLVIQQSSEASLQPLGEPSLSTLTDPSVPPAVSVSGSPAVEHALQPLAQHAPEPSMQSVEDLSLQSSVENKRQSLMVPSSVVEPLAGPSDVAMQDKIQTVKVSERGADNRSPPATVSNALLQTEQGPEVLAAQEDQSQPDLKVSALPDKPTEQPLVYPSKTRSIKEKEVSKGRKKKKQIAVTYTLDKQVVNGVTSPVEKTITMDHNRE
ncbi:uncharacterized protein, partial [Pyxicephalus adspersus]|uniref:uncharacterized protein n=1 Tax=Pyxicephalus adspersus TaxID=30357 RepID=UPI003B5943A1